MFTQAKIQGAFEQFSTKSFFLRAFQVPLEVQKLDSLILSFGLNF